MYGSSWVSGSAQVLSRALCASPELYPSLWGLFNFVHLLWMWVSAKPRKIVVQIPDLVHNHLGLC